MNCYATMGDEQFATLGDVDELFATLGETSPAKTIWVRTLTNRSSL